MVAGAVARRLRCLERDDMRPSGLELLGRAQPTEEVPELARGLTDRVDELDVVAQDAVELRVADLLADAWLHVEGPTQLEGLLGSLLAVARHRAAHREGGQQDDDDAEEDGTLVLLERLLHCGHC